jgi:hypothetical protein
MIPMRSNARILELIPVMRNFFLKAKLLMKGAKISCVKLDPPSMMAVRMPMCMAVPPASAIIAGITVSTSMKLVAKARKPACQRKEE